MKGEAHSDPEISRRRIPEFDGLRAVAILAVLGIHAGERFVPGGHLGVSVFFVLSGYLITTILVRQRDRDGRIDFAGFYVKRAARLFPALVVVLVVAGAWAFMLNPAAAVWRGVLSAAFYVSNFMASHVNSAGLAHFEFGWTLSLEEQFYLVWPILLVTLLRRPAAALVVASAGVVASEAFRLASPLGSNPPAMFFAPHTRMSGLLLGAVLALALHLRPVRMPRPLAEALAALAVLVILVGFLSAGTTQRATYAVWIPATELATAALLLALLSGPVFLRRPLAWRPIAYLGLISYSIYLWNIPAIQFVRPMHLSQTANSAAALLLTLALAVASFHLVERPAGAWIRERWANRAESRKAQTMPTQAPARLW